MAWHDGGGACRRPMAQLSPDSADLASARRSIGPCIGADDRASAHRSRAGATAIRCHQRMAAGRRSGTARRHLAPTGAGSSVIATITLPAGQWRAVVDILPTYADRDSDPLRLTIAIDGVAHRLAVPRQTGDRDWAQAVLDNRIALAVPVDLPAGTHRVTLQSADPGALIEAIRFESVNATGRLH